MRRYAAATALAALLFGLLDFLWLSNMAERLYRPVIGEIMADSVNWAAALSFYALYILGMVWFAVRPGLQQRDWRAALLNGALLGGLCYATYDLTSQAVLKLWATHITLIDIAWGSFATSIASALTTFLVLRFSGRADQAA